MHQINKSVFTGQFALYTKYTVLLTAMFNCIEIGLEPLGRTHIWALTISKQGKE